MRKPSRHLEPVDSDAPVIILTDDGGSGLYEACRERFASPEYVVTCDIKHTVWVKRADGTRSFGMPPWLLRQRTLDDVLARADAKLLLPVAPIR